MAHRMANSQINAATITVNRVALLPVPSTVKQQIEALYFYGTSSTRVFKSVEPDYDFVRYFHRKECASLRLYFMFYIFSENINEIGETEN